MSKNDGGPAFGQVVELRCVRVDVSGAEQWEPALAESGMSLRDYFAAKELSKVDGCDINDQQQAYQRLASHCYKMADAMLNERSKPWKP